MSSQIADRKEAQPDFTDGRKTQRIRQRDGSNYNKISYEVSYS